MSMISNHPDASLLADYVCGQLDELTALMVAAHVDLCPHCQQQCAALEARQAALWLNEPAAASADAELEQMLGAILAAEPATAKAATKAPAHSPIILGDQRFEVPRALQRFTSRIKPWRRFGSKIWQSRLEFGDRHLQLLFMDQQGSVPQHTHKGREITLVLHGGFEDESGEYRMGDFVLRDGSHRHTPVAAHESCLCIALTDAPLHFTSGLGRLLNPIAHWLG